MNKENIDNKMLGLHARPELLAVVENISKDKGISMDEVFSAMEAAIKKAAAQKYGYSYDLRATIHKSNGAIIIERYRLVVEEEEDHNIEINLKAAKIINQDLKLGDYLIEELPPVDFGRVSAWNSRQIITQKVREAEKEKEYESYKDKVGEIVSGTVRRIEFSTVIVELEKAEACLSKNQSIPRENLEVGSRVKALVLKVEKAIKGPQIFLSRAHPDFIAKLFSQEVPEIYDGIIQIKNIARDAGSRTKIAVLSTETAIDPVGTCVGFKGGRIQTIINELRGEKIDLVEFSDNVANFVVNAFYPTAVLKVFVDEDRKQLEVVIDQEKLSIAIGRGGQNIRLISQLVGWQIDLMTLDEEKEKRNKENKEKIDYLMKSLDVDEVIAQLLVVEGFSLVDEILETSDEDLANIQGFGIEIVSELKKRATLFKETEDRKKEQKIKELEIQEDLINFKDQGLNIDQIIILAQDHNIKNLVSLADLSSDELLEIFPKPTLDLQTAEHIIMEARKQSYDI